MKALLLAGGYATRLRPLTDRVAKPLLPVGGRPMIDWIVDRITEAGIADEVHLVTNAVYASDFERWAAGRDVTVWNDGTSSNDDRLGAIGDVQFAIEHGGLAGDDLLVIAADNLFEFSLAITSRSGGEGYRSARLRFTAWPIPRSHRSTASSSSITTTA